MSATRTRICHRLGRSEQRLRAEAAEAADPVDLDARHRLASVPTDELRRLVLNGEEEGASGAVYLFAELGLHRTLQMLLEVADGARAAVSVAAANPDGWTPLHAAAAGGHWTACEHLLDAGLCMTAIDRRGRTPLDLAAARGHAALLEAAFDRDDGWRRFLGRHRDHDGRNVLHAVCRWRMAGCKDRGGGSEDCANGSGGEDSESRRGSESSGIGGSSGESGSSGVGGGSGVKGRIYEQGGRGIKSGENDGSSMKSSGNALSLLLRRLDSPGELARSPDEARGWPPGFYAAQRGNLGYLKLLAGRSDTLAGLLGTAADGRTALHAAAQGGSAAAFEFLRCLGLDPAKAAEPGGEMPAHDCARGGHASLLRALLTGESTTGAAFHDAADASGQTPLHCACEAGSVECVRLLSDAGHSLDALDDWGRSPAEAARARGHHEAAELLELEATERAEATRRLHAAAECVDEAAAEAAVSALLSGSGCRVWERDRRGWTAAHVAAHAGSSGALKRLLAEDAALLRALTPARESLLHAAVLGGQDAMVELLLLFGLRDHVVTKDGATALRLAALGGRTPAFKAIAAAVPGGLHAAVSDDEGAAKSRSKDGRNLLHLAAAGGSAEIVRCLLALRIPHVAANVADARGRLPVHHAARCGRAECLELLVRLEMAACGRLPQQPPSLYHLAASSGSQETFSVLTRLGLPVMKLDAKGRTLLHAAASGGSVDMVKDVAKSGVSPNSADASGATPAFAAASAGRPAVLEFLLGAVVSTLSARSRTPKGSESLMHAASRGGCLKCVNLLAECGLSCWDDDDKAGWTPAHAAAFAGRTELLAAWVKEPGAPDPLPLGLLHAAAEGGHADTVQMLLDTGRCNPFERDAAGRTVAHCAAESGDPRALRAALAADRDGAMATATDAGGRTLMHTAAAAVARTEVAPRRDPGAVVRRLLRLGGTAGSASTPDSRGCTPVDLAILAGNTQTLAALLSDRTAQQLSEMTDAEGRGLLHAACLAGQAGVVRQLVAMGLSSWQPDGYGLSPAVYAAAAETPSALRALLDSSSPVTLLGSRRYLLLGATTPDDKATLAHVAAHANRPDTLRLLAAEGFPVLRATDVTGATPMHNAVAASAWDAAAALVDAAEGAEGAELAAGLLAIRVPDGRSLLHLAAEAGHSGLAMAMVNLDAGCLSARDSQGLTPMHAALLAGQGDLANQLLLLMPTTVELRLYGGRTADGRTPLHLAAAGGNLGCVRLCLNTWPLMVMSWDSDGQNTAHAAARHGRVDALRLLLDAGVEHKAVDKTGRTPMHAAAAGGHSAVWDLLQDRYPELADRRDLEGLLPFHHAVLSGQTQLVERLLRLDNSAGGSGNVGGGKLLTSRTSPGGDSLLHLAARSGSADLVRLLMCAGLRCGDAARNSRGRLPSEEALAWGHADLLELLTPASNDSDCDGKAAPC